MSIDSRLLFVALFTASCGDIAGGPCDLCPDNDPSQGCYRERRCDLGNCRLVDIQCEPRCNRSADCLTSGHQCEPFVAELDAHMVVTTPTVDLLGASDDDGGVDDGGGRGGVSFPDGVCSPYCDDSLCSGQTACDSRTGRCAHADCSASIACADSSTFCDQFVHRCYPTNGACGPTLAGCPLFDGREASAGHLFCDSQDQFCRLVPAPPVGAPGFDSTPELQILSPTSATLFADQASIVFEWAQTGTAAVLLVLDKIPAGDETLTDHAIWGMGVAAGAPPNARWNQGVSIVNGVWQKTAAPAPRDTPLYFLAQAVAFERLTKISKLVPFGIGNAWRQPGDPCQDDGSIPGTCANPAAVQGCVGGACRVLCASTRDCMALPATASLGCSPPMGIPDMGPPYIRICE